MAHFIQKYAVECASQMMKNTQKDKKTGTYQTKNKVKVSSQGKQSSFFLLGKTPTSPELCHEAKPLFLQLELIKSDS